MDEIFNILSSSARIDKSKRKKKKVLDNKGSNSNESTTVNTKNDDHNKNSSTAVTIPAVPQKRTTSDHHSPSKLRQIHHEEIAAFRNKLGIHLSQTNRHDMTIPDPISSFGELKQPLWWSKGYHSHKNRNKNSNSNSNNNNNSNKSSSKKNNSKEDSDDDHTFTSVKNTIVRNVENGRWINPTPIQMQAITAMVGRRDVLGCAPTGSGKSGAFIIPTLLLSSVSDEIFYGSSLVDAKNDVIGDKKKKNKKKGGQTQNNNTDGDTGTGNGGYSNGSSSSGKIRALLLAPSRELASQLYREVERLGEGKLHGIRCALLSKSNANTICNTYSGTGTGSNSNSNSNGNGNGKSKGNANKRGLDVLVSTPLRLLDCIERHNLDLGSVRVVVLDEADRLLDGNDGLENDRTGGGGDNEKKSSSLATAASDHKSGSSHVKTFLAQIDTILSNVPSTAVRALFSATIGSSVRHLAESILRSEVDISIISSRGKMGNSTASGVSNDITQKLTFVGREEGKLLAIRQIIAKGLSPPVIIFLQSKDRAQALFLELMYDNINVDVIHAGKSQAARDAAVAKFRKGETWILICTDLCARGLDFKAVNMVINYDLPTSGVTYVHRIGRCGRAGRKGEAITLFTEADFDHLRNIANVMKLSGCDVPDWMLSLKKNGKGGGSNKRIPLKRKSIDTSSGYDKKKLHRKKQCIENSKGKKNNKET